MAFTTIWQIISLCILGKLDGGSDNIQKYNDVISKGFLSVDIFSMESLEIFHDVLSLVNATSLPYVPYCIQAWNRIAFWLLKLFRKKEDDHSLPFWLKPPCPIMHCAVIRVDMTSKQHVTAETPLTQDIRIQEFAQMYEHSSGRILVCCFQSEDFD